MNFQVLKVSNVKLVEKGDKMKRRIGNVSNSSTTSFLMHGKIFVNSDFELKDGEDLYGKVYDMFGKDFEIYSSPYDDDVYVGKSLDDIGQDETRADFAAKVNEAMSKAADREIIGDSISGEWRDG